MKILWRSVKDKIIFMAIEKYRYDLWKSISKHLNRLLISQSKLQESETERRCNFSFLKLSTVLDLESTPRNIRADLFCSGKILFRSLLEQDVHTMLSYIIVRLIIVQQLSFSDW